ncbi:CHROMATIN COMPLEXES SUBUNIT BAP18-RELATED [Salix purpurea]|uniref:ER membrane protein complex subunit 10 n=1 Tax=Salix purpurea TaxID=77065 RepID=A0A9Q0V912_SALPP|nr:CHROMATIN COMPLEXES SUBUNIT BAP18-RELATED [Salix purpurea]
MKKPALLQVFALFLVISSLHAFQSDELDEEFGLEGGNLQPQERILDPVVPTRSTPTRGKYSDSDSDSKIQISLEQAFGDSDFFPAATFSARLKTWSHGAQTLTKLRFSRNSFTEVEKQKFQKLLEEDEFYRIRLPSNVLNPTGKDFVISSVRASAIGVRHNGTLYSKTLNASESPINESIHLTSTKLKSQNVKVGDVFHGMAWMSTFVIHTEGVNILAVNYGPPGACPYPRQLRFPAKWSFNSHTVLKNSEQAPRTPIFAEDVPGELGEGETVPPPERSFWAKYWMYLIPLGLIVMNAMTQAMNLPEEQATGQSGAQPAAAIQRGPSPAVRRR